MGQIPTWTVLFTWPFNLTNCWFKLTNFNVREREKAREEEGERGQMNTLDRIRILLHSQDYKRWCNAVVYNAQSFCTTKNKLSRHIFNRSVSLCHCIFKVSFCRRNFNKTWYLLGKKGPLPNIIIIPYILSTLCII